MAGNKPLGKDIRELRKGRYTVTTLPKRPRAVATVEGLLDAWKPREGKPIRSRRVFKGLIIEDLVEKRAVGREVLPASNLERIQYKRSLILFGPPGPSTWETQYVVGNQVAIAGLRLDFVYWLNSPAICIEPQGRNWHDAFARPIDEARAFAIRSLGYRYAELWEEDILANDDAWLDDQLRSLVGGTIAPFPEQYLSHKQPDLGLTTLRKSYKENRRLI